MNIRMTAIAGASALALAAGTAFGGAFSTNIPGVGTLYFGRDLSANPTQANPARVPDGMRTNADGARGQFESNIMNPLFESFEGATPGAYVNPFSNNPTLASSADIPIDFAPDNKAVVSGDFAVLAQPANTGPVLFPTMQPQGRYPSEGNNYLEVGAVNADNEDFTLSFFENDFTTPKGQQAFGFYGTDIGDVGNELEIELLDGAMMMIPVDTIPDGGSAFNASIIFWGIILDDGVAPIVSVRFVNSGGGTDIFGFDEFIIATPEQTMIPLPTTVGLGAAGLLGIAAIRRRRLA